MEKDYKRKYEIVWSLGGTIEIEAENEEQAHQKFNEMSYDDICYVSKMCGDSEILEINEVEYE